LRASDADREQVAERLRNATAEGRLLAEELEQRLGTAFRARTYGELDALVADLPGRPGARRPGGVVRTWVLPALALSVAAAVLLAVIVAVVVIITGVLALWMVWAALGWWFLGRRRTMCRASRSVSRPLPLGVNAPGRR
jgi:Flp pilus assembly protein TadB